MNVSLKIGTISCEVPFESIERVLASDLPWRFPILSKNGPYLLPWLFGKSHSDHGRATLVRVGTSQKLCGDLPSATSWAFSSLSSP